jgi:hypothetical protein
MTVGITTVGIMTPPLHLHNILNTIDGLRDAATDQWTCIRILKHTAQMLAYMR